MSSLKDLIDKAYQNYLDNFLEPICPPTLDVQPDYYLPSSREWFEKGLFGNHYRSVGRNGITSEYGITIETRFIHLDERKNIWNRNNFSQDMSWYSMEESDIIDLLNEDNIPTKLIILTYNKETIEKYE
jgi:hypothetical protein